MNGLGNRHRVAAMRAILSFGIGLGGIASTASGATFTVNSNGDESDAFPGDGVAEIAPGTDITTFRSAIEEANAFPGPDLIVFDLCDDCSVIRINSVLPPLNDPLGGTTIIGSGVTDPMIGVFTRPTEESPTIRVSEILDGSGLNAPEGEALQFSGLKILSAGNTIAGMAIRNFPGSGVLIEGEEATENTVRGCFIGLLRQPVGNGLDGVTILEGAANNVVGGNEAGWRCVIGANGRHGVYISGEGTDNNRVVGNFIGCDVLEPVECAIEAVFESEEPEPGCNGDLLPEAELQRVTAFPNLESGVRIDAGASGNIVGGLEREYANFIAGTQFTNVGLCKTVGAAKPKQVAGQGQYGVAIEGAGTDQNVVLGNHIGFRVHWFIEHVDGVTVFFYQPFLSEMAVNSVRIAGGAQSNTIGGAESEARNNIGHSIEELVVISGSDTSGNVIRNNRIGGVRPDGFEAEARDGVLIKEGANANSLLANDITFTSEGVVIESSPDNYVGTELATGNSISVMEHGVRLTGAGATGNVLKSNEISGNGFSGVVFHNGAKDNTLGGVGEGEGNRIFGNTSDGVVIYDPGTNRNSLLGNEIFGNRHIGVFMLNHVVGTIVGGVEEGAGNRIYENGVTGIEIHDLGTTGNFILGNDVYGNGTRGIFMVDGTSGNVVGGEELLARNKIHENTLSGIEINGEDTAENQIRINSIYDNGGEGIFLSFGANRGILPPVIETFIPFAGTAEPGSFVDIFSDDAEEGRVYIGTTLSDEEGRFSSELNLIPFLNTNLTVTGTDDAGNTSEFSEPIGIIPPSFLSESADMVVVEDESVGLPMTVTGAPEIHLQWRFRPDGGVRSVLVESDSIQGVNTSTLVISGAESSHEGFYQCVADNGLGAVNSREVYVRVVPADLNELQVNTLGDASDGNTSSFARLLASPGADGLVSLREAITAANTMAGENVIGFSVEGIIVVESPLPALEDSSGGLTIDGGEVLAIDGGALEDAGSGLVLYSGNNRIAGLGLYRFPEHGVVLSGASASGNVIVNCRIGTDGEEVKGNGIYGAALLEGASGNLVGGVGEDEGNLVAGNAHAGIALLGEGTSGNLVQGNIIGDPELGAGGNALAGVFISESASDNVVGGDTAVAGNVIAGNTGVGVYVVGSHASRNTIRYNVIYGNGELGIRLFEGGNDSIEPPAIESIDPLSGTAPSGSMVDFFSDRDEEGEMYLFSLVAGSEGTFSMSVDLLPYDGSYLTATATSEEGNTSAFSSPVPMDFTPPVLTLNGSASVVLDCGFPFDDPGVTATDNLDLDIANKVQTVFLDGDGETAGDIASARPGEYTLRYEAADQSGFEAAPVIRALTIGDLSPPEVTLLGESSVILGCGDHWNDPGAMATDACDGDVPVAVSGEVISAQAGTYTLTYTAEDAAGNHSAGVMRSVTIMDSEGPEIVLSGTSTISWECGVSFEDPGAVAMDACGGEVEVFRTGTVDPFRSGLYTLHYDATDSEGNHADTVTRTVILEDRTPPLLVLNGAAEVTITCGEGYAEQGATLTDACDPGAEVLVSGDFNPNAAGVYTLFYNASDTAGNEAETVTRTVTVLGGSAPTITVSGAPSVSVPCNTVYQDAGARAVDGCQTDITAFVAVDNPVDPSQPGTYTVTYTVMDGAGTAAAPATRTVTVLPCVAPCEDECDGDPDDGVDADGDGLSACKEQCLGTSDSNPDSDGDGMPDGFEYMHQLNPAADDGDGDADLDGTGNTDEFLEGGLPRDPDSPRSTFYVSPLGADRPEAGTRELPWQSIGYALNRVSPRADTPVRLFLDTGLYVEDLTVMSYAELRSEDGALVEIMGTAVLQAQSGVEGITFTSDGSDTGILFLEGGAAAVRDCTVNGEFGQNLTGVVVESGSTPRSVLAGNLFHNLDTGIDVSGALPVVRQCTFANIAVAAILIRDGASASAADSQMGHGLNGWNDFSETGDGLAVLNQSGAAVSAQWNDWGTDSASLQQAMVEGAVNQGNALAPGGAVDVSALDVVVTNGANQSRVAGASVALSGSGGAMDLTSDGNGRAQFPALPTGTWQIAVTASGFPDASASASLQAGVRRVVNVVLHKDENEPTPGPSCPGPGKATGAPAGARGDLVLLGLLIACLVMGQPWRSAD